MAEQTTYVSPQAALDAINPGWKIIGEGRPFYLTEPVENPLPNEPATRSTLKGQTYSIRGPNGENDEITLGAADNTYVWNTTPGAPLPKALVIIKAPQNQPSATSRTPTASGKLDKLDANGELLPPDSKTKPSFVRDPAMGTTFQTKDDALGDPSTWTQIKDPNDQTKIIALYDPSANKIAATVPQGSTTPKRTGEYTDLIDPNDPKKTRVIGKIDTGSKEIFGVSRDPTTQKQIVSTPGKIYVFNDDGSLNNQIAVDQNTPYQAVMVDGIPYRFDPHEKDPTKAFQKAPGDWDHPPIKDSQNNQMVWSADADGGGKYVYPPGVQPSGNLVSNTTAKTLDWYDAQGNLIRSVKNTNYVEPTPTLPAPNSVVPRLLVPAPGEPAGDDHPAGTKWIKNNGQVMASAALQQLATQLSGHVVDGSYTADEAKAIIDAANANYTNRIAGAKAALDYTSEGARTGAGMLQQRAATAQGLVNQALQVGTQRPLYAGVPAGVGEGLVRGATAWSAELMGGQETLDAAAAMVRAANPNAPGPMQAAATSALTQLLQGYRQVSDAPHPIEQAFKASQQSVANGGATAPNPVVQPVTTGASLGAVAQPFGPNFGGGQRTGAFGGTPPPFAQSGLPEGRGAQFVAPPQPAVMPQPVAAPAPTIVINAAPQTAPQPVPQPSNFMGVANQIANGLGAGGIGPTAVGAPGLGYDPSSLGRTFTAPGMGYDPSSFGRR